MKKFMAVLLTLAMVSSLLCGMTVFAEEAAVTVAVDAGYEDLWADAAWDGTYLINNTGSYKFKVTLDGTNATLGMVAKQTITAPVVCIPSSFTLADGTVYTITTIGRRLLNYTDSSKASDSKTVNKYIEKIVVSNGITTLNAAAFRDENVLTEIVIPASVTSIGEYAFANNPKLTTVTMADDIAITTIASNLFNGCGELAAFEIPDTVTTISNGTFISNCFKLNLTVEEGNTSFKVEDGVLYSADGTKYLAYIPAANTETVYTIPDGKTIGAYAFTACPTDRTVIIPESYTTLTSSSFASATMHTLDVRAKATELPTKFAYSSKIQYVKLSDTITYIKNQALYSLSNINGIGTEIEPGVWDLSHVTKMDQATIYATGGNWTGEVRLGVASVTKEMFRGTKLSKLVLVNPVTSVKANSGYALYQTPINTVVFEQGPAPTECGTSWLSKNTASVTIIYPDTEVESFEAAAPNFISAKVSAVMPFGSYISAMVDGAEGGYDVTYAVANYKEKNIGKAVIALYDADENMVGVKTVDATVGTTLTTINIPANGTAVSAKIFTLNSFGELTPQYVNYEYVPVVEEPAA